jgi:indole-3-glycerol phosphate synthase / phosphoribosylanthranilate isomerase
MNVLDEIVSLRRERLRKEGPFQGLPRPERREAPLNPFLAADGVILEMKRASPSKGDIDPSFDPARQAGLYADAGATNVSVLTEEDRFRGSLSDLIAAKRSRPELSVLRKDFLLDRADVEASYLCGADAVLLIASILGKAELADLAAYAESLGMSALVEIHDAADAEKARACKPALVGINSRDLRSFAIDPLLPLRLRRFIDWPARIVYESGIRDGLGARFVGSCGFGGILVGEAVTRSPELVQPIKEGFTAAKPRGFWSAIGAATGDLRRKAPLVKICGITNVGDYCAAKEAGADLCGFILAPSPRKVETRFVRSLGTSYGGPLRVGVVTDPPSGVADEIPGLVEDGFLDALQFHDPSGPQEFRESLSASRIASAGIPFYKAIRLKEAAQAALAGAFGSPRVLFDAYAEKLAGGTGTRIPDTLLGAIAESTDRPWLAGGLGPSNVAELVAAHRPELVDASSGLEKSLGQKDNDMIIKFMEEVAHAAEGL